MVKVVYCTKLLEPHSKIVGYFLGKDIIHTNRDDITNRLAAHISKYSRLSGHQH